MTAIRKPTLTDMALIVSLGFIWGTSFLAIKFAVREFAPTSVAAIRIWIAFVMLFGVMLWKGQRFSLNPKFWGAILFVGIFNTSMPFFLISWAEQTVDSGIAALLMGTSPLLAMVGSHFTTNDDHLSAPKLIAVALGMTGVLLVVGVEAVTGLGRNLIAQLAIFSASLCYVASGMFVRRFTHVSVESFTAAILLVGALSLTPWLAHSAMQAGGIATVKPLLALLYLGLVPTGLAYLIRFYLIRSVGYSYTVLGIYIIPVVGVLLGNLVLGEPLETTTLLALALIISGIVYARLKA
ncbi:MAG: EamA/RhaT family transporter [Hyphomicrobiales bacterium]|nr:MAG: EamA/RhaT family transporter [Hyphomicrobiales bacterium]